MNRSRLAGDAAGPHNAIVDVAGVSVGHVDIRTPDLHTGLTAVVPYPASVAERKLFIGRFAIDGGDAMSGLGVAEDFGTFSSPIVLAPVPVVGRVYESLIRHSLGRDTGLSTATGWPPVVVGIDDTAVNDPALVRQALTHAHAEEALANAGSAVSTGNAGVGGGLLAFGYKGGIGTASRRAGEYALGVLAPVPVVGRVYESLIRHSLGRDTGLSTATGWPPVVVGIDDTAVNDPALVRQALTHAHAEEALANAGSTVPTGNAGVGGGLLAFGYKGGIGTASRRAGEYALAVLAAVNGGRELHWAGRVVPVGEHTEGPQTFAAIVATDAPLIPRQLERLAGRAALGLARTGLWNPHTREGLVLAFSTTGIIQEPDAPVQRVGEEKLYSLFAAGAVAAEAAVADALLAAEAVGNLKAMPQTGWPEEGGG